jgi:hypothetical protein
MKVPEIPQHRFPADVLELDDVSAPDAPITSIDGER